MIALLQRVSSAQVIVNEKTIAKCSSGLLVYVAIEASDDKATLDKMANKIINYRIFADTDDKMNLSVKDIDGDILLVPQFTLAANTDKGMRPSFSHALKSQLASALFADFLKQVKMLHPSTLCGQFQANMQIQSVNDGPATFILSQQNANV